MRLDKFLSNNGIGTRKEVKLLIKKGFVTVNGQTIKKDDFKIDEVNDQIYYNDELIGHEPFVYLMMNKPAGLISATTDNYHQTVIDIIGEYRHLDLFPVGRLDIDTEGLLLITNDGHIAHELLTPKKHVSKVYYARIDGRCDQTTIDQFKAGITLEDGFECLPAHLKIIKSDDISEIEVEIFEGKFHQVKRMFLAVGMSVIYLKRIKMKNLVLDDQLKLGEYRKLTPIEQELLLKK